MKRNLIDASQLELEDKVVSIKRVTKVVKGGDPRNRHPAGSPDPPEGSEAGWNPAVL